MRNSALIPSLVLFASACAPQVVHEPAPPDVQESPPTLGIESTAIPWRAVTYPLWGLPRDLADAPLTMLNRAGMSLERSRRDDINAADATIAATAVLGAVVGFGAGWEYANAHLYEQLFYSDVLAATGACAGYGAGHLIVAGYEYVLVPVQVGLLRTGLDDRYLKCDATRVELDPAGSDSLARLEASYRSTCYFPNWRLAAHQLEFSLRVANPPDR